MDLVIPTRIKKQTIQFTVEMDLTDRNELMRLAREKNLKFHRFIKVILYRILKDSKENLGELQMAH